MNKYVIITAVIMLIGSWGFTTYLKYENKKLKGEIEVLFNNNPILKFALKYQVVPRILSLCTPASTPKLSIIPSTFLFPCGDQS